MIKRVIEGLLLGVVGLVLIAGVMVCACVYRVVAGEWPEWE